MDGEAERDRFDMDAVLPDLVELGKAVISDVATNGLTWPEALLTMAHVTGEMGYRQGQADLMARFLPVRFTADATLTAELEGEEAQAFLRELGIHKPNHS